MGVNTAGYVGEISTLCAGTSMDGAHFVGHHRTLCTVVVSF